MLDAETDQRRLLLVWVHGFKGDESTFLTFPQDLADAYQAEHPTWDIQHVIYPKYKTAGQLAHCTEAFAKWVEKRVAFQHEWSSEAGSLQSGRSDAAPGEQGTSGAELSTEDGKMDGEAAKGNVPQQSPTDVVLVGHSMGGLLVADAATKWLRPEAGMPVENGTLLRIRSVIALDTPFIGINPSLVSYGVNQLDAAVARLHTSTSSFIIRSPSSVQKTWKSIGGDKLLSPPTQSLFGADSRLVKGVQWGLDIAAQGSERGFMADMGVPAFGRLKDETEAERKEREGRQEREKKEKMERKDKEKREKADKKERERMEKAEKKEREKKEKEERKEKEKREKERRREKEKIERSDKKERERKVKKWEQEKEQKDKQENRDQRYAGITIDKDKKKEETIQKEPEGNEHHTDGLGDIDQHEQDVGIATSKLAVSNDVVQSAHNEKEVQSGPSVVRVTAQDTDPKESDKDIETSAEEPLPSASTPAIGPQPVSLPTLSLPSSAENSSTNLLRVASPGTVLRTSSAGPSASASRTPSVVSMDSAASDFSSDTDSSSNGKKQRRGWHWLQSHMIFLLSLWRTEEVWRRMRVLAEMQKEGLGFVNIYTVVPHPEDKSQSRPNSPSAPPTSPCTFISLPATTQIPANSWRPFEIDVPDQVTAHMALFMRDKNKRYDELMDMIRTQIDDDM